MWLATRQTISAPEKKTFAERKRRLTERDPARRFKVMKLVVHGGRTSFRPRRPQSCSDICATWGLFFALSASRFSRSDIEVARTHRSGNLTKRCLIDTTKTIYWVTGFSLLQPSQEPDSDLQTGTLRASAIRTIAEAFFFLVKQRIDWGLNFTGRVSAGR